MISRFLCLFLFFFSALLLASNSDQNTQNNSKLKQIVREISILKNKLLSAQERRSLLNKALMVTEKQIGFGALALRQTQKDLEAKAQRVDALHQEINKLSASLEKQQLLLAKQLRARYQMGAYQPLKWLITQDDPCTVSRMMTYYQYLLRARQDLLLSMDQTRKSLDLDSKQAAEELKELEGLKLTLIARQKDLAQKKQEHKVLIEALNRDIHSKATRLVEAQKDQERLKRLLSTLPQGGKSLPFRPFYQMRRKLPYPLAVRRPSMQPMNQGVTFFADEGAVVTAVYPGKVLFSDWLKGYGFLLILDHGQGFMTLYAHNQSVFKKKGDYVRQNEQIATVGHSGGIKQSGLYFEIRQRGKAIPPYAWFG